MKDKGGGQGEVRSDIPNLKRLFEFSKTLFLFAGAAVLVSEFQSPNRFID